MVATESVCSGIEKRKDPDEVVAQKQDVIELLAMLPDDGSVSHSDFNERLCAAMQACYRRGLAFGRSQRMRSERYWVD